MSKKFNPYADEAVVLRVAGMEIENRLDRVTFAGEVVLTRDKAGLAIAKDLLTLMRDVVKILEADKQLPDVVNLNDVKTVKNPFA